MGANNLNSIVMNKFHFDSTSLEVARSLVASNNEKSLEIGVHTAIPSKGRYGSGVVRGRYGSGVVRGRYGSGVVRGRYGSGVVRGRYGSGVVRGRYGSGVGLALHSNL